MISIDLTSNIQGKAISNINSKKESKFSENFEVENNFKSFFYKEVKKDIKIEDKSVNLNRNTEDLKNAEKFETKEIKETLETSLEKIKVIIDRNYKDDDIEVEDIIEVINLLSNLLITGDSKIDREINAEEIVDSNLLIEGNLENIKNLISEVKEGVSNFEENTSSNVDDKGIIENLKSLGELINTMLKTGKNSMEINLDKESLNKEILNLLNFISEKDIEKFKLSENLNNIKEIIFSRVNIKNYNENLEVIEEPITLDKENINLKDIIKINSQSDSLQSQSNNSEFENFFKGNTRKEVNEDIKEEDKFLSKFFVDDNKGTVGNISTFYDSFKNNSVDVIQNPEFINTQTMDDDIIKAFSKETFNDIKSLLSEVEGVANNLDVVTNLNKETLNLLNSILEKDVEIFKLPENQNRIKEIISSLVDIKNYNENIEVIEEPITLDKESLKINDDIKINIKSNILQSESNNSEFENVLTSYDSFKNNLVDVIQKPEFINSQTMDDDIIKTVKYMMKNNIEELTVNIYPKELREITIKILSEEGVMKAEIKTSSKEIFNDMKILLSEVKGMFNNLEVGTNINLDNRGIIESFKLPENQSNIKEIISSLVNIENYNEVLEVVEEPIILNKESITLKDDIKTNIKSNNLQSENTNNEFKNSLNENTGEEVDTMVNDIKILLSEVKDMANNLEIGPNIKLDNRVVIENLKSLYDLINNMLETGKDFTEVNLNKENINKETLNLLNSFSEKDLENFKLPENQSKIKEIISSLDNIKNYNENLEIVEEPITLDKGSLKLKNDIKTNIQSNNLQSKSNNSEFGNLLKENTGKEVSEDIKEEDKILSKFLVDDNKGTFENVLTPYDRFKNNSVDVIQKPEFINSQTMDDDIIKSVKYMMKNNMEKLTVKVYPKELGELTIKILSEEGIMKAEIKATSKEAYSILNANISEIKNSLSEQNIKIQDVQVAIYNDDTTFFSGKKDSRENQKDSRDSNSKVDSISVNENESLITEYRIESNVDLLA